MGSERESGVCKEVIRRVDLIERKAWSARVVRSEERMEKVRKVVEHRVVLSEEITERIEASVWETGRKLRMLIRSACSRKEARVDRGLREE